MSVLEFKSAKKKTREGFEPGSATGRGVVHQHYCPECAQEFACVQGLKHHVLFQHQERVNYRQLSSIFANYCYQ